MSLTLGQKLMCGIALSAAALLAASVRMSCTDGKAGSIHVVSKKLRGNEPGKVLGPKNKSHNRGDDGLPGNRRK